MTEIKLTKRYPQSRTEDITDAFMRGYEQGKNDGLKVGKQIVLGAFETYITADRKTEPQSEYKKWETKPKATIPKEKNNCVGVAVAFLEDEPQTDCPFKDVPCSCGEQTDCAWKEPR